MPNRIDDLLTMMGRHGASDLHLKAGEPAIFRINGDLVRAKSTPFTPADTDSLLRPLLNERSQDDLARRGYADFAYALPDGGRFRCNVFRASNHLSAAVRRVKPKVPTYEELHLPAAIARLAGFEQGLVLVGGITGSGKSTTIAAVLDDINRRRRCHILTIEDPIEYTFTDDKSLINQREIGIDVASFEDALRSAVREDPDVMLLGEMRDAETFETALTAAETGHLVFGTIHSSNCPSTIGRILDLFPPAKHASIRSSLGFNLRAVVNQKLVAGAKPEIPQIPAVELMFVTPIIRKMIIDSEDHKVADALAKDNDSGSESFTKVMTRLYREGLITMDTALASVTNPEELRMALRGITISDGGIVG
jgi:twitching motility protein PilT